MTDPSRPAPPARAWRVTYADAGGRLLVHTVGAATPQQACSESAARVIATVRNVHLVCTVAAPDIEEEARALVARVLEEARRCA